MSTSLLGGEVRLRDGRRLAYAEYGNREGRPVFFFHGTPGSRLFRHPDNSVAASAGARVIAIDRPGFGRSDFQPGRTLLDWPNDVVELANALDIKRFAVAGYSTGGAYALACAAKIPDRLTAVGLIGSMAPMDNPQIAGDMQGIAHMVFSLDRRLPVLARLACWLMCTCWRYHPGLYLKYQINGLSDTEESHTLTGSMKSMLTADLLESIRSGTQGISWDLTLIARPWRFHFHSIATDVFLWHGEDDNQAPLAMGKHLASVIPNCHSMFFPGEGNWIIHTHWQEILTVLASNDVVQQQTLMPVEILATIPQGQEGVTVISAECSMVDIADIQADPSRDLSHMPDTSNRTIKEVAVPGTPGLSSDIISVEAELTHDAEKQVILESTERQTAVTLDISTSESKEPEGLKQKTARSSVRKATGHRKKVSAAPSVNVSRKPAKQAGDSGTKRTAKKRAPDTVAAPSGTPPKVSKPAHRKREIAPVKPVRVGPGFAKPQSTVNPESARPVRKPTTTALKKPRRPGAAKQAISV